MGLDVVLLHLAATAAGYAFIHWITGGFSRATTKERGEL